MMFRPDSIEILRDANASKALQRYFKIVEGKEKAKYLKCKELDEKIKKSREILESCHLCERRCNVNRLKGEKGVCGVLESRINSEFIHWGEEPELVPSYTIFFSGCTFKCVFCQNWDISQCPDSGLEVKPETLAKMIEKVKARNVNWVGGEPTPNLAYILEVLSHLKRNIAQVWNSNMYVSLETMELLDGVVDVYLADFKYGNNKCAVKYSKVPKYWEIITRNHIIAKKQAEMIIRHLVLPNHIECCTKPVLEWISKNLDNVRVNVMDQYRPEYKADEYEEINRRLEYNEFKEALSIAQDLGLNLV